MRLKACICNCVKSLKIGGISPMMQPLKNCAFSLCETLNKIGKCLPVHGDRPPISLQFYSVNVLRMPLSHFGDLASHTKFRTLPIPTLDCQALPDDRWGRVVHPVRAHSIEQLEGWIMGLPPHFQRLVPIGHPEKKTAVAQMKMGNLELDPLSSPLDGFFAPLQLKRIHRRHVPAVRRLFEACLSLTRASTSEHRRGRAYQRL